MAEKLSVKIQQQIWLKYCAKNGKEKEKLPNNWAKKYKNCENHDKK